MNEELLQRLGDGTANLIERLWAAVEAGTITEALFTTAAADVIAAARARGQAAATAAFRGYLEAHYATATPAAAPPITSDQTRLRKAVDTVLADPEGRLVRLSRLARDEPIAAAVSAYSTALADSEVVTGWRRGLDSNPCQLCVWWWREGRVFRDDFTMPRHTGCTCTQQPVLREQTSNYQTANQMNQALASRRRRTR